MCEQKGEARGKREREEKFIAFIEIAEADGRVTPDDFFHANDNS